MVYGTDNGVYLSDLREHNKVPVKVISVPNVTQLDVLEEQGILIVLAGSSRPLHSHYSFADLSLSDHHRQGRANLLR